jgi:hypothetical protein
MNQLTRPINHPIFPTPQPTIHAREETSTRVPPIVLTGHRTFIIGEATVLLGERTIHTRHPTVLDCEGTFLIREATVLIREATVHAGDAVFRIEQETPPSR